MEKLGTGAFLTAPMHLQTELNRKAVRLRVMETDNFINLAHVEITGEAWGTYDCKITLF